ncbi:MAG TPA: copper amine oxidase N-terminal domain-containing protein [Candidatus Baltobacteraceae bacterium]|nr:copper amine oxidase N-terminal domain-containing protein [Candidatus Baltobacteraceae bacterium]
MKRLTASLLILLVTIGAAPHKPAHHRAKQVGKPVLPIALVLNGTLLSVNPPPVFYKDHLLVPVRRILGALGLTFEKEGRYVRTYAGAKTIELLIGSSVAQIDNQPVTLDAPPVEIKNVLYAPLRFFAQALQAQAVFNRQTNSVEIVSTLVGRSGNGIVNNVNGDVQMMGTITGVDLDSDPPTITLTHNASIRTLTITPGVSVMVQDVNAGTSNAGNLAQLHTGDYAHLYLTKEGAVKRIVDAFGSRTGVIAAIASEQIVLDDGHVIVPSRATTITLNGSNASVDKLAVGDELMVRYNIDSSEPLQILATRTSTGTPPPASSLAIAGIDVSPDGPLRTGQTLYVTLHGTPGGHAVYDIGPYVTNQQLSETQPGVYTGTYKVARGQNFAGAPVLGRLNAHGMDAPQAVSKATVSVSTQPPGIVDFAPDDGSTVNNPRPSIYATFAAGTVDVNSSSARIEVNGHDVTSGALRTERFIHYTPGIDYPNGAMRVTVRVSDAAGNTATKSWTFFIRK